MDNKIARLFIILAISIAWLFDRFFWQQSLGLNFPVFMTFTGAASILALIKARTTPAPITFTSTVVAAVISWIIFLREEPFTRFTAIVTTGVISLLAIGSYQSGNWWKYGFRDHILQLFRLGIGSLSLPLKELPNRATENSPGATGARESVFSILRGLLISAPVLLIVGGLLASADPIFSAFIDSTFGWLQLDRLPELVFRLIYVSIGAYIICGMLIFIWVAREHKELGNGSRGSFRILGTSEANTVLFLLNAMLITFIVIQIQYFFGGSANITTTGFTYAEYARRGFFELVAVSVLGLALGLVLSTLLKETSANGYRFFTANNVALFTMLIVILVSSFQRLLLYETAYGFTRLRVYTHIFIIWLGVLLVIFSLLQFARKLTLFPLALIISCLGFTTSLAAVNVDRLIVRENFLRLETGAPLDYAYLLTLSNDAVPQLVELYRAEPLRREELAALLSCIGIQNNEFRNSPNWLGANQPFLQSKTAWADLIQSGDFTANAIPDSERYGWYYSLIGDEKLYCLSRH